MEFNAEVMNKLGEIKVTGGGGYPFDTKELTVDPADPDAQFTTVALAAAAAAAGDCIRVGAGTHTVNAVDIPLGVDLRGSGKDITILQTSTVVECVNFQGSNVCSDLTIQNTYDTASSIYAVKFEGADVTCEHVHAIATNATGSSYAWNPRSTTCVLKDCDGTATGPADHRAVSTFGGSVALTIEGGTYNGTDYDISSGVAGDVITINEPILVNGTVNETGTVQGFWVNAAGDKRAANTVDIGTTTASEKMGDIFQDTDKDIYPGGSSVGLQYRFEQLFGDDVPADPYFFTVRDFRVNNFPGGQAGFEDSQASPYNFGGAPGGFSVTVPANTQARSNHMAHFLTLQNQSGSGVYMDWTAAVGVNNIIVIFAPGPLWATGDYNLAEIRMWGVQAPGAADRYWAMRINWMGTTFPDYPMRMGLWYGTGVTYAHNDGTLTGLQVPHWGDGMMGKLHAVVVAGPSCFVTPSAGDGASGVGISNTVAGWPTSVKTCRIRLDINYTFFHIDTFRAL